MWYFSLDTLARLPTRFWDCRDQKKLWVTWRMTQKRISWKTTLAKYNFRKSGGRHEPPGIPFVGGPVMAHKHFKLLGLFSVVLIEVKVNAHTLLDCLFFIRGTFTRNMRLIIAKKKEMVEILPGWNFRIC